MVILMDTSWEMSFANYVHGDFLGITTIRLTVPSLRTHLAELPEELLHKPR